MGGNFISILTSLLFRANLVRDEPYNLSEHSGNEGKYQSMKQHANMRTLKNKQSQGNCIYFNSVSSNSNTRIIKQ